MNRAPSLENPQGIRVLASVGGALLYSGWAYLQNVATADSIWITCLVQFAMSLAATYCLSTLLIYLLRSKVNVAAGLTVAATITSCYTVALILVHLWARTPNIVGTVTPISFIAGGYAFFFCHKVVVSNREANNQTRKQGEVVG